MPPLLDHPAQAAATLAAAALRGPFAGLFLAGGTGAAAWLAATIAGRRARRTAPAAPAVPVSTGYRIPPLAANDNAPPASVRPVAP